MLPFCCWAAVTCADTECEFPGWSRNFRSRLARERHQAQGAFPQPSSSTTCASLKIRATGISLDTHDLWWQKKLLRAGGDRCSLYERRSNAKWLKCTAVAARRRLLCGEVCRRVASLLDSPLLPGCCFAASLAPPLKRRRRRQNSTTIGVAEERKMRMKRDKVKKQEGCYDGARFLLFLRVRLCVPCLPSPATLLTTPPVTPTKRSSSLTSFYRQSAEVLSTATLTRPPPFRAAAAASAVLHRMASTTHTQRLRR